MASLDIQIATTSTQLPPKTEMLAWIEAALPDEKQADSNISLRLVDEEESRALNLQYRAKDKPTNVLSFPCELPAGVDDPLLGDLVICAPVVEAEAQQYNKALQAHWAHMLIHGTLHLLGYDHIEADEAEIMENRETIILSLLGFPKPYEQQDKGE